MGIYSQSNEDQIILEYFSQKMFPNNYTGNLLEIGCNDCKTLSNSLALIELGWKAVLVDPSKTAFKKCKELHLGRSTVFCYNFAIADFCGEATFHESGTHLGKGDTALLSTIKSDELKRWEGSSNEFTETKTKVFDYKTFLKKSKIKVFDFISIDAEGVDLDILKQIDLNDTNAVCIEYNSDMNLKNEIVNYCSQFGLTNLLLFNGENIILAR